jgi:hypothetical protein
MHAMAKISGQEDFVLAEHATRFIFVGRSLKRFVVRAHGY